MVSFCDEAGMPVIATSRVFNSSIVHAGETRLSDLALSETTRSVTSEEVADMVFFSAGSVLSALSLAAIGITILQGPSMASHARQALLLVTSS